MKTITMMHDTDTLTLRRALLLYENSEESFGTALATVHDVVNTGDTMQIGAGQLLSRSTLLELMRRLQGLPQRRAVLPERALYADSDRMLWWSPSTRRPIWFMTANKGFTQAMNGREVQHPPLLFLACPGRLYIWALGENVRPTEETQLFRAPYFNLYTSGMMCRGNAHLPDVLDVADLAVWERGFFDTQFTHSNYAGSAVCSHPRGHDGLWRSMRYRQEWRPFPVRHLMPLTMGPTGKVTAEWTTVGDVLNTGDKDNA